MGNKMLVGFSSCHHVPEKRRGQLPDCSSHSEYLQKDKTKMCYILDSWEKFWRQTQLESYFYRLYRYDLWYLTQLNLSFNEFALIQSCIFISRYHKCFDYTCTHSVSSWDRVLLCSPGWSQMCDLHSQLPRSQDYTACASKYSLLAFIIEFSQRMGILSHQAILQTKWKLFLRMKTNLSTKVSQEQNTRQWSSFGKLRANA